MSPRGGARPGAGQPPIAGVPQTERLTLKMTEGERAEIEAAVPGGKPVSRWIVEAALQRARKKPAWADKTADEILSDIASIGARK